MSTSAQTPLAIVGLACHLPGASSPDAFWELTLRGTDALSECPPQWAADAGFKRRLRAGRVSEAPLDFRLFKITPQTAEQMHRGERMLTHVVAQSMLDAGFEPLQGPERCGIYLGATGIGLDENINSMLRLRGGEMTDALGQALKARGLAPALEHAVAHAIEREAPAVTVDSLSTTASIVAGRVSAIFNTTGGHFAVDAGPASSLAALHVASQALSQGRCDVVTVGALSPLLSASTFAVLGRMGWLANEHFEPLGARAQGTLPGEGAVSLVLCRLEDAERDGRKIYAVLRSVTHASHAGQQGLSRLSKIVNRAAGEALDTAGVDADAVAHVELQACGVVPWEDEDSLASALRMPAGGRAR